MADNIYFQGQEKIAQWIARVKEKSSDPTELYQKLGGILLESTRDRFTKTNVAPDGRPWQQSWRAKAQGTPTLLNTKKLRDSIYVKLNKDGAFLSTNLKYAPMMQFGGVIKAKNGGYLTFKTPMGGWVKKKQVIIPARPFLGVSEDDAQLMLNEIADHLEELLKNA